VEEGAYRKFKRTCLPALPRAITRRWRGGPAPQAAGRLTRRSCLMLGERQQVLLPGGGVSKPVATAAVLNLMIAVVEAAAGVRSGSLSLLVDSVHNLSDEMALILLFLAFIPPAGLSRNLLRSANFLNWVGLAALSGLLMREVRVPQQQRLWPERPACGPPKARHNILGHRHFW
jgi:Cation efflux family